METMISIHGTADQLPFLPEISAIGAGIELGSYGLVGIRSEQDWQQRLAMHQALREQFDGPLALHGPFIGMNFAHADHLMRDVVQQRLDMTFAAARLLRASRIILHSGYSLDVEAFNIHESWINGTIAFLQKEIGRWAEAGIGIALENDLDAEADTLVRIADAIDSPWLGLCLDIGHHHIFGKTDISSWVSQMRHRLVHIHLHNNDGIHDRHWPMGRGTIDFAPFFEAIKTHAPKVTLSIEVEDTIETKLGELRNVIGQLSLPQTRALK